MTEHHRKHEPLRTDELPLAAANRRLRRRNRQPRGIDALMAAVLTPPSGTPLRLVHNAVRASEGAGRN